jgi:hypothetical protein
MNDANANEDLDLKACNDCGRLCYWDEDRKDYRHAEQPDVGCFLIAAEVK